MNKTNRRRFLLSTAGLAGWGALTNKTFANQEHTTSRPIALNTTPVSPSQDSSREENHLQCRISHEDYLYYQSKVDQFMRNIFPQLFHHDKDPGDVVEFGSYRGYVTKKLIRLYGSKVAGFEIQGYKKHPYIHSIDFVKNPSCLKSDRLILGWNGFRRWSSHPTYRAKAFELIVSRLVPGGLYIDDCLHEHTQDLKVYGLTPLYKDDFIGCFQKV